MLYEHCSNNGQSSYSPPAEHELREVGFNGLHCLVPVITEYAIHIRTILPYNVDHSSPFVCNCLYRMVVWLSGAADVSSESEHTKAIKSMKDTLHQLSKRWRVAGESLERLLLKNDVAKSRLDEYLKILDDVELTYPATDEMALDVAHEAYNPTYMYPTGFVVGSDVGCWPPGHRHGSHTPDAMKRVRR